MGHSVYLAAHPISKQKGCGSGGQWCYLLLLTLNEAGNNYRMLCKGGIPANIKIFLWLLENNVALTEDNLTKRKQSGNPECCFCDNDESTSFLHMYHL
jgi:hypothetical protein